MMAEDIFGISDTVRSSEPPAEFAAVHQSGYTWPMEGGTYQTTTRIGAPDWSYLQAQFRGLLTAGAIDLSDITARSPFLLREFILRFIAASLPAVVADQLPDLAELLDEDPQLLALLTAAIPLALNANNLTAGTVPAARLAGVQPAFGNLVSAYGAAPALDLRQTDGGNDFRMQVNGNSMVIQWSPAGANTWTTIFRIDPLTGKVDHFGTALGNTYAAISGQTTQSFSTLNLNAHGTVFARGGSIYMDAAVAGANTLFSWRDVDLTAKVNFLYSGSAGSFSITHLAAGKALNMSAAGVLNWGSFIVRDKGNTPDGTTVLAQAGSDTEQRAWPATALKAAAQAWGGGIGSGQTRQVPTFTAMTSYQNLTGKTIALTARNSGGNMGVDVSPDNSTWPRAAWQPNGGSAVTVHILPGEYYRFTTAPNEVSVIQ